MRVAEFVACYWQRQAVCIRQAIDGFATPVTSARLLTLAGDAQVESRLVTAFSGRWRVRHGPFARAQLPSLRRGAWTLLVQGVDLHDAAVAALARRFRFLPAARYDDAHHDDVVAALYDAERNIRTATRSVERARRLL